MFTLAVLNCIRIFTKEKIHDNEARKIIAADKIKWARIAREYEEAHKYE